ncbi:MAG: acylneuraminate cytidylyltransferase family protein [Myxococcota bacterium]|nr:acylneuraminate cytidylyltransferase family protein [Myxococcota bacterium]
MSAGAPRVLGLIPARGGSKGIPRKNIRPLGGRPLLAWTAECALAAQTLTRVVLSTDDEEIAEVGRAHGLEVPFLRPPELATDAAGSLAVVIHAVRALSGDFDAVCLLQPTDPFRPAALVDRCVTTLFERGASGVVSVLPVPTRYHPDWVYRPTEEGGLRLADGTTAPVTRRQELGPAFIRSGAVYVTRTDTLLTDETLYGDRLVGVPHEANEAAFNLDTMDDWRAAEAHLASAGGPE